MGMIRYIYTNSYGKELEFSKDSGFSLFNVDGISSNKISLTEVSGNSQIGTTATNQKIEPKDLTFEGDYITSYSKRRALIDTIAPGVNAKIRLIDDENDIDVYIEGQPITTPVLSNGPYRQKFQFVFHCPFPFWTMTAEQTTSFSEYISYFRFPRSFSNTTSWKISERRLLLIENIKNEGTLSTGFVAVFKAVTPVTCPELLKISTQEVIRMTDDFVLEADDVLEISTHEGKKDVTLTRASTGVSENAFQYLADESVFWQLDPGDNIVRYGASDNHEGLEVTITAGITLAGV